jgi:hypothetical protein
VDLQLILRVLWRFRLLVGVGCVLAVLLAAFSYMKLPSLEPRQDEQWESLSTLFVTSKGFPWGSIGTGSPDEGEVSPGEEENTATPNELDPVHLTGLAALYVRLATTDPVLDLMRKQGPIDGELAAFPVNSDDTGRGAVLPMVTLSAMSSTPEKAQGLASRHAKAFVQYLNAEQKQSGIPADEQVQVQVIRKPAGAELPTPRKKTRPMVVFVAVMIAVIGLAFALENLRPRVRVMPAPDLQDAAFAPVQEAAFAPVADAEPLPAKARRRA